MHSSLSAAPCACNRKEEVAQRRTGEPAALHKDGGQTVDADQAKTQAAGAGEDTPAKAASRLLAAAVADDRTAIGRSGRIAALADLIWIPQAFLLALSVADMVEPGIAGGPVMATLAHPGVAGLLIGLLALVRLQLGLLAGRTAQAAAERVKARLRARLLGGLAEAGPSATLPGAGAVAAAVTDQIEAAGPYVRRFLPLRPRLSLVPLAILVTAFAVNWLSALILLAAGPMIPLFMALIGLKARAASDSQHGELARMGAFLLDRLRGLDTLRLAGALERTDAAVAHAGERFRLATMKVLKVAFLSSTVLELFSALGLALVAVYVGFSLLGQVSAGTWGAPMDLFTGLFVLLLAPEFFAPLRAFAAAYHDKAGAEAAARILVTLPLADPAPMAATPVSATVSATASARGAGLALAPPPARSPEVILDALTLAPGGRPVIDRLSLRLPAGGRLIVAGPSGAGKSTLIDALTGLRRIDGGRILLDGLDLAALDLDAWRARLAFLSQEPRLFFGTVTANLRRARPEATEAEMWAALDLAGARDLVEQMPRGLGTRLGEDGFGLSVGEARRIALARAALRRDALMLIADEPTAGLDDDTAGVVIAGLERLSQGVSTVIASHDPRVLALPGLRLDIGQRVQEVAE
ncbi:thiol reductant ABC exporter subunit CydD [Microvirga tunisiensis]|uniref:Thiol reductant ABC exporter subunit CydD n=1 Tax=Pannonibacter tanglangensis TaxID=2750084 RepID=A0ABW9ZDC7_9HYPH|nr:thiol reductant ABC exporter subunit CydD [Pannonibacter sp. XCT-34]